MYLDYTLFGEIAEVVKKYRLKEKHVQNRTFEHKNYGQLVSRENIVLFFLAATLASARFTLLFIHQFATFLLSKLIVFKLIVVCTERCRKVGGRYSRATPKRSFP